MAWYYGVNNSELYGSNFSTVLADAPPPLDDTFDEDDNEIVFRNDVSKSTKCSEKTVVSPGNKRLSSNHLELSDKSRLDGSVPNGEASRKLEQEGTKNAEMEDDFGDFASFADFGSAFGQGNTSGEQGWFTGDENSVESEIAKGSQQEQAGDDDEYDDFAAFQENEISPKNLENIPNGSSDPRKSNNDWLNNSAVENKNISINSSYDMESDDDDFGDFACVENAISSHKENASKSEDNSTVGQPDVAPSLKSQGKTVKDEEISIGSEGNAVQCSGDLADKRSVNHSGEPTVNQSSNGSFHCVNEEDCNSLAEQNNDNETGEATAGDLSLENSSSCADKDQELRPLGDLSVTVSHDDDHSSGISSVGNEEVRTNKEKDQASYPSAVNDKKEESDSTKKDEKNYSSTRESGLETEKSPENMDSNDDSFGEFADFNEHPSKEKSLDSNEMEESVVRKMDSSSGTAPKFVGVTDGTIQSETAPVEDRDSDIDFGGFGSFEENCVKKDGSESGFAATDLKPNSLSNENEDDDDDDDDFEGFGAFESNEEIWENGYDDSFGKFNTTNSSEKPLPNEDQSIEDDVGNFATFSSNASDSQKGNDSSKGDFGDFDSFKSNDKGSQAKENDNEFGDFGDSESNTKISEKDDDDNGGFGEFGGFESNGKDSQKVENDDDFGDFGGFESNDKDSQKDDSGNHFGDFGGVTCKSDAVESPKHDNAEDFGDFGRSKTKNGIKDSLKSNDNTDDVFGDFGGFESKAKDSQKEINQNNDDFGDFGSFESKAKHPEQHPHSNNFGDFGTFKSQTTNSPKKDGVDEFGDFGAFESEDKSVDDSHSNVKKSQTKTKESDMFGDVRTSESPEFGAFSCNSKDVANSGQTDDDFGDFSGGRDKKTEGFASFSSSASHSSVSVDPPSRKNVDLKQHGTGTLSHFSPGVSIVIKQAGDPISTCFTSEQRHVSGCQCDVLSTKVEKGFHR